MDGHGCIQPPQETWQLEQGRGCFSALHIPITTTACNEGQG